MHSRSASAVVSIFVALVLSTAACAQDDNSDFSDLTPENQERIDDFSDLTPEEDPDGG